jgi:hypothetical protein
VVVTDPEIPFVSHAPYADTTTGSPEQHAEARRVIREGVARLHAQAKVQGAPSLTELEQAARQRAKDEKRKRGD